MPGLSILESPRDRIERWVMFAVEFTDPVTGGTISDGLIPSVEGLPPPLLTRSGRFAWRLDGAAAARPVKVALAIRNPMFGPPEKKLEFTIEPNDGVTLPDDLLHRFVLTTTPAYQPPPGMTGAVGTVLKGAGSKDAMPGVKVAIELKHDEGTGTFLSRHVGVTDEHGAFAAVVKGLSDEKPDRDKNGLPGAIVALLRLEDPAGAVVRRNVSPALRLGRITYLTKPIKWSP